MYRRVACFLFFIILVFSFSACTGPGKNEKTKATVCPTATYSPVPTPTNIPTPTKIAYEFVFPKEGERPVAVMIDNQGKRVLPQGGLDKAQLIYEITVEGGETRLMPVFWQNKPKMIGPVRSSRHYYLDYVLEHDAVYVHFGWSPQARNDISLLKINNINGVGYGGEVFWDLTKDRGNWQDSYTSMERVNNFIKKAKYRTLTEKKLVFNYNQIDTEMSNGEKAENVSIKYNSSISAGYVYDPLLKQYLRIRDGEPHMERVSKKQLMVKNIIIQHISNYGIKGDMKGRQSLANIGNGNGWFITDGKAIKIKWSKQSRSAPTQYTDETGNSIMLNPGLTWIQITPISGKVKIE